MRLIDRAFSIMCKAFDVMDPEVRRKKKVLKERPECFKIIDLDYDVEGNILPNAVLDEVLTDAMSSKSSPYIPLKEVREE